MAYTIWSVIGLTVFVVIPVGYVGYLAFGNTIKSVIIYNLPSKDPISITVTCCYLITIMGSYVIMIQPIFYIIEKCKCYKYGCCCRSQRNQGDAEEEAEAKDDEDWTCAQYFKFMIVRLLIPLIIFFISTLVPNVNVMLIISGALCGTLVTIVVPVLFYYRAFNQSDKNVALEMEANQRENGENPPHKSRRGLLIANWFLLVVCCALGIYGIVHVILTFGDAKEDKV